MQLLVIQFNIISRRFYAVEISMLKIFKIIKIALFKINWITNSCIWNTCVTWQGIDYNPPEDDTIVSKHVGGVW
jgi:hypothetical protein